MGKLHVKPTLLFYFYHDSTGNMWQCLHWLFLLSLSIRSVLADPLYRWQDAQGNIHYSDHHPPRDAKVLHPDVGHEPTPEELEAAKSTKLAKEAQASKKEVQQKEETPKQPVVIIPVPIIQNPPEVYMPYWGPIYPYRRQLVYPHSRYHHVHPRYHRSKPPVDSSIKSDKEPLAPSKTR
jgi:hypothetical protein